MLAQNDEYINELSRENAHLRASHNPYKRIITKQQRRRIAAPKFILLQPLSQSPLTHPTCAQCPLPAATDSGHAPDCAWGMHI